MHSVLHRSFCSMPTCWLLFSSFFFFCLRLLAELITFSVLVLVLQQTWPEKAMQLTEVASHAMSCYTEGFTMLQHSKNMSHQLYAGVATEGFTMLQHSKNMPRQFYA